MRRPILAEGENCWRKAHADRVAFIVDAADYFAAAKDAILKAEQCVYLIGWEFDLDIRLRPDVDDPEVPDELRQFLQFAVQQRPELQIYVLQWRGAMLFNIARQLGSYILLKAKARPQIHFRLDGEHPMGACHHQKIVVIDDVLAFCGGIDMTSGRWDTHEHRSSGRGELQPWHDMTVALDGEAARRLAELARRRWKNATDEDLPVPVECKAIWPEGLEVDIAQASVGIARTDPGYGGKPHVDEVAKLWCAAIRSAEHTIYIENQYLSSGSIAQALRSRLEEDAGPEIVIVLPCSSESWLESEVMDTQRSKIVADLRAADEGKRLGVYHPVNDLEDNIYVHAKLLIVDDNFVRVGSSNMSSRSLAIDTECDLAMEFFDQPGSCGFLTRLRTRLMAEHLGTSVETVEAKLHETGGSIHAAIESLRKKTGRTLQVLEVQELTDSEQALAESRMLDPEEPINARRRLAGFAKKEFRREAGRTVVCGLLIAAWAAHRFLRRRS